MESEPKAEPEQKFEEVTILNVLKTSCLDLAFWVNRRLLDVRVPVLDPNMQVDIVYGLLPLLGQIANKQIVATELFNIVVGATPPGNIKSTDGNNVGTKEMSIELNRRKEILYRTIQTLEAARETTSRLMTGLAGPR